MRTTSILCHSPKRQRTFYQSKANSMTIIALALLGLTSAFATSHHGEIGLFSRTCIRGKTCENKTFVRRAFSTSMNINRGGDASKDTMTDGQRFAKTLKDNPPEPCFELPDSDDVIPVCKRGIILVDSFCPFHGKYLDRMAREAYNAGVVNILSEYLTGYFYFERGITEHASSRAPRDDDVENWIQKVPFDIVGIVCESDSGLGDAEKLGVVLGLFPSRHDGFNEARRDKFLMNECMSEHGMRVVRQKLCTTVEDAVNFASELGVSDENSNVEDGGDTIPENPQRNMDAFNSGTLGMASNTPSELSLIGKYCIVKPCRGVASDGVEFCPDLDAVRQAFDRIRDTSVFGSTKRGEKNEAVLVQEFAAGTEYVLDIVSKAGEHKCAALWRYDKRSVNGSPFVYFATEIIDAHNPTGQAICEYAMKALDALGVKWGMSHNEFIVDKDGPRLVEVNCRQHNTDFAPLTSACMGYNALDMLLSAYLGDAPDLPLDTADMRLNWDDLPVVPEVGAFGAVVHLVCHVEGIIIDVHDEVIEEIRGLPSVVAMEVYPEFSVGNNVEKTINIRSDSGWVHIINDDEEQFQQDYNRIVDLMPLMFSV